MSTPSTTRDFLVSEIDGLEPFDILAVAPAGEALHVIEVRRTKEGVLEAIVPGRPPVIPPLSRNVVSALTERGFASEDPESPMRPWRREVADGNAGADLILDLLTAAFGEKPDVRLDIGHSSYRSEHEGQEKLKIARARIESIVNDILGQPATQDNDGDYVLPIEGVHVMVSPRAMPNGHVVIRIFCISNVGVNVTPELGLMLSRLNFGLMFGRFVLDTEHRAIWFDESLLGEQFREEELRFAIGVVASTADEWDDRLKRMFGGVTYQEVLQGRTAEATPPIKPGDGVGMYL